MKLSFFKRHCCSFASLNPPNPIKYPSDKYSQILHFCKSAELFSAIHLLNAAHFPSQTTSSNKPLLYACLLQTCTNVQSFPHGLQFHAHVIKSGLETDRYVGNSLLALYFKLGPDFRETRRVFDGLFVKDVISWTSMISGYVKAGKPESSLEMFFEMWGSGVEPNGFTLSTVIKACSVLGKLRLGCCFHGVVMKRGFDMNRVISSALIDFYGRNCQLNEVCQLFDELPEPDAICWTSVISALTRNDLYNQALGLFYLMQRNHGLIPDGFTFGTVLTACGNLGRLRQGKQVHAKVIASGLCGNVVVESSLLDMYGKCGLVDESQRVFDRMSKKNSVSWSALLGVYCQNKDYESVIRIFRATDEVDIYCFGTILRACAGLAAVRQGKEVHCQYVRRGGWKDVIVESALVDLYAKCGCIDFALRIFLQMSNRNLITWNSMIYGFAQNGRGGEALSIFDEMIKEGLKPDYISFIGVLFACSHAGLVDQGRKYFTLMTGEYGIKPGIEHFNCMVDLLGRAGLLEEAENLIANAEFRDDSSLWAVLLGACSTITSSSTTERIARKMIELAPDYHMSYVLLANVYRAVGRWNDAIKVRKLMKDRGVKKIRGMSWIETTSNMGSCLDVVDMDMPGRSKFLRVRDPI
ncbi:LOW QUALITY PROTEIN: pentatricopeptide repeat-containing protein At1g03540-like [Durio zibethinus]|uniref:LOW QUALITY PROTEIN: pentatricopeptide repeat-containing protein At1g03540-like n=1 Tax=Durio zibethinus TaxID=66656 RepID=A0A6P5XAQ7_DURZI|nr:LOW QUALITY PROTEIN: pentatricopeptide repeat-containing protein At1g03540-like [Durio zibethinus]